MHGEVLKMGWGTKPGNEAGVNKTIGTGPVYCMHDHVYIHRVTSEGCGLIITINAAMRLTPSHTQTLS